MLKRFLHWLDVTIFERRMWWRFIGNKKAYEKTRQWLKIDQPAQVYEQVAGFVREVVNLSGRPYGQGAYGLVLAAVWDDSDRADRWQVDFRYSDRQAIYGQLNQRMAGWSPPPSAVMVGVLPYGELVRGL